MATTAATTTTVRRLLLTNHNRSIYRSLSSVNESVSTYRSSRTNRRHNNGGVRRFGPLTPGGGGGAGIGREAAVGSASFRWWMVDGSRRWMTSLPSHEVVGMPSLSPTMEAGTIATWNVSEGDSFSAGDSLAEIETDKATMSFEAQDDGYIAKILAEAGPSEISCGKPILVTVEEEEDVAAFGDFVAEAGGDAAPSAVAEEPPVQVSAPSSPESVAAPVAPPSPPTSLASGDRTVASPLAWTIAKEKGFDLSSIAIIGTGPDGRIIADDVREYVPLAATATATTSAAITTPAAITTHLPPPVQHDGYTDYPLSPTSLTSAALLTHSKQTVPHYYLSVDVALDALLALRARLNAHEGNNLTMDDLLLKATASAMKSVPDANASWMGDSVRRYDAVDINYVMGNGKTMVAPLLNGVESRGLGSLSKEIAGYMARLTPTEGEQEGEQDVGDDVLAELGNDVGTVTVMNLGMYGVKSCAPIIREPQAVALALGAAENRLVPKELENDDEADGGENYDVKVMLTATLSCDHRVVDGAVGAQWLSAFKTAVESPEVLLL